MPVETHAERVKICLDRLQYAGLIDSTRSDIGIQVATLFGDRPNPEIITKNLLYLYDKGFDFNKPDLQQQLLNSISALEERELFFKFAFEYDMSWRFRNAPALMAFWKENLNKDQSSSMYFGLKTIEAYETLTPQRKEQAVKLLAELESKSYLYREKKENESYHENSIDLLPERVAANFVALKKEGYAGVFALEGGGAMWGGVSNGLTEMQIKVLANPHNKETLGHLAMDLMFSALGAALSAASSRRESVLGAAMLQNEQNGVVSSTNFLNCWKRVLIKLAFYDLVVGDNEEKLNQFIRQNGAELTPDALRTAFTKLPSAPTSDTNRKLLLLQQGVLESTESTLAMGDDTTDPIARNMQVALRTTQTPTLFVNWPDALTTIPLANFSSDAIAQRTRLIAIAKLQSAEARKALGLEKLDEAQQATLIRALQENCCVIDGDIAHLSGLLKNASAAHGALLINYFITDRNKYNFTSNDLKTLVGISTWMHTNSLAVKKEDRDRIDFIVRYSMEQCISSMSTKSYSQFKQNDRIRQAWKAARAASEKTEAEQVYRAVQKLRESNPTNVKAVSQTLSDYMTKNPTTAFTTELRKIFGDFFTVYTPSKAIPTAVSTLQPSLTRV